MAAAEIELIGIERKEYILKNEVDYVKDDLMISSAKCIYASAPMAGLKEIPVIIRNYSEREIMEISLIENIQREDSFHGFIFFFPGLFRFMKIFYKLFNITHT